MSRSCACESDPPRGEHLDSYAHSPGTLSKRERVALMQPTAMASWSVPSTRQPWAITRSSGTPPRALQGHRSRPGRRLETFLWPTGWPGCCPSMLMTPGDGAGNPPRFPLDLAGDAAENCTLGLDPGGGCHVTDDPVEAVFGSEPLGEIAARISAVYIPSDTCRSALDVPSSAIRADLPAHWRLLSEPFAPGWRCGRPRRRVHRQHDHRRLLAEEYRRRGGAWADTAGSRIRSGLRLIKWERARAAARAQGRTPPPLNEIVWETPDFDVVGPSRLPRKTRPPLPARPADMRHRCPCHGRLGAPLLRYPCPYGATLGRPATAAHDLYLLTDHVGCPGSRWHARGRPRRACRDDWLVYRTLTAGAHSWVLLTGPIEQRLALAVRCTEAALATRHILT